MRDDPCFNIPGFKFALLSPEVVSSGSGVAILCPKMIISYSELSRFILILSLFLLSLFPPLSSCSSFVSHGVCPIILSCFPLWYFVMTRCFFLRWRSCLRGRYLWYTPLFSLHWQLPLLPLLRTPNISFTSSLSLLSFVTPWHQLLQSPPFSHLLNM